MKKRTSFIKFIQLWSIVFLLAVGGSLIVLDITISYWNFHLQAEQIRDDYIVRQKEMIKQEVDQVVAMINYEKAQSDYITKEKIKTRVYEAHSIAKHIYEQNKESKSKAEIKQIILDALRPIRFAQGSGYYFATRLDGIEILFADKPELEGSNLLGMQDTQGKYVIKDMIKIVRQAGEGFYEYHWTKPGAIGNNFKKIAFVKRFDPFNWFIGTGIYVDNVEDQIKTDLLSGISQVRFGKEGYIFVNRLNGDALVSNGERFSGSKKLWQIFNKDPEKIKAIFDKEYKAAAKPGGDFIYYSWIKLSNSKQESPKTSFIYGLPDLQWLVGAGVYLDDVETDIAIMHSRLNKQSKTKLLSFALVALGMAALFLLLFRRLNRKLENDFNLFSIFFERAAHSDKAINRDKVQFVELDQLAKDANLMLHEKINAQKELMDERKALLESEQKYREMVNLLPQMVYEEDSQGNFTFVNEQTYNISGYSADDFSKGINASQVLIPEDRDRAQENIMKILAGSQNENVEYTALRKDGSTFPISTYSIPIIQGDKIIGLRGIAIDISEIKRLEAESLNLRKLESVGVLAGGIAHDFNNILAAILGNISLALTLTDPENETYELLASSEKASLRAKDLTQQLLTFAKGGEPVKKIAAIDEIIKDSAAFVLRGSNVRCEFNFGERLRPVAIDTGQISQVIQNIVINASQAMPTGGIIKIDCANQHLESNDVIPVNAGNYIKIVIKDQGVGIPTNLLDKVFDPYFTTKQKGSGLGLALTHSIIVKHNGYISIDSKPGLGTSISLYLPAAEEVPAATPPEEAPTQSVTSQAKIMIMDDEEMIRELVVKMLSRFGYEVTGVKDGDEALQLYRKAQENDTPIDLIIMDLTIPGGVGGQEAVKKIHQLNPQAKVIVASGYANDPVMADYEKYGFRATLTKPFQLHVLREVVEKTLSN